jgi:ATP-dependent helicase/nuclease subunit A
VPARSLERVVNPAHAATEARLDDGTDKAANPAADPAEAATAVAQPPAANPAYAADGHPIDAERFYAIACDPARSVVVEACAGAGKTWMLVSRILRALLAGTEAHQILAITFTRKAAGEMRARLDEWLGEFGASRMHRAQRIAELQARGLGAIEAESQADALGRLQDRLLAGMRPVEVSTFHGWFAQLLGQAPLALLEELGLPAAYTLLEDPAPLKPALFGAFHREVHADARLRDGYRGLIARHRRAVVQGWLESAWSRAAEIEAADAAGRLETSVPPATAIDPAAGGADGAEALLGHEPLRSALAALAAELEAGKGSTRKDAGAALQQVLHLVVACGEPSSAFALAWRTLFTKDGGLRKRLSESPEHATVVASLEHIEILRCQQRAHEDHLTMSRLARVLLQQYQLLKRRLQLVDMADLERAALALLADPVRAGWVQERLDQRLRQVLIDEFQDTSPLQWRALQAWLSAYAGAGGGASGQRPPAVFIVGDPKQSIYRFRNAEPRVFAAARDFVRTALGGCTLACDHTRRTAPEVIAALNAAFTDAAREDGWPGWRAHTTAAEAGGALIALPGVGRFEGADTAGQGGAAGSAGSADRAADAAEDPARATVPCPAPPPGWRDSLTERRHEPEEHRRRVEARQIAQAVRSLLGRGLAPGAVMVLARRRSTLALVAEALAAEHVPHAVAETLRLEASPEALDLIAVLDTLSSPAHDLSLARALRSPLIGADDTDLLQLARSAWVQSADDATAQADPAPPQRRLAWRDALLAADPALLGPALRRAQTLWCGWVAAARELPPHDLLDRVVHEGEAVARFAATVPPDRRAAALIAIDALLAASLALAGGRFASLHGFVRELRAGRLPGTAEAPPDAVQLLTVHGAKGLEATAVFLADADPQPKRTGIGTLLIDWPMDEEAPQRVAFVRSESQPPPSLSGLWAEEQRAREREEINALYVAATRARRWLLLSRTEPRIPARPPGAWRRLAPRATPFADWLTTVGPSGLAQAKSAVAPAEDGSPAALPAPAPAAASAMPRGSTVAAASPEPSPITPITLAPVTVAVPTLPRWSGRSHGRPARPDSEAARDSHAARLGQAVHRLLEWAGCPGEPLPRAAWPAAAVAATAAQALPATAAADVLAAATAVLDSPACALFFRGPGLIWAANELPLAGAAGPLRVDRVVALRKGPGFESADTQGAPADVDAPTGAAPAGRAKGAPAADASVVWWVLDYKLGRRPGEVATYREQLAGYRDALLAAQPGALVRAAFITGRGELVPLYSTADACPPAGPAGQRGRAGSRSVQPDSGAEHPRASRRGHPGPARQTQPPPA